MKKYYTFRNSFFACIMLLTTIAYAQNENLLQVSLDNNYAVSYGNETISGVLLNTGDNVINNAVINWQLGNGVVNSHPLHNLHLASGAVMNFTHPDTWVSTPGKYTLRVWASNVNGVTNSNVIEKPVQVAS